MYCCGERLGFGGANSGIVAGLTVGDLRSFRVGLAAGVGTGRAVGLTDQ